MVKQRLRRRLVVAVVRAQHLEQSVGDRVAIQWATEPANVSWACEEGHGPATAGGGSYQRQLGRPPRAAAEHAAALTCS